MPDDLYKAVALRLLGGLYASGDHVLTSFLFGPPELPSQFKRLGVDVYVREADFLRAVLFLRSNGAPYLRDISYAAVRSMATKVVSDNYWAFSGGVRKLMPDVPFSEQVSKQGLTHFANAIRFSALFDPKPELTLYPLVTVRVHAAFQSEHLFFTSSEALKEAVATTGFHRPDLLPAQFPPVPRMSSRPLRTTDWLGISAPVPLVARKKAFTILGAVALTPVSRERYLQAGRTVHGGYCTLTKDGYSVSSSEEAITPRISSDIELTEADHQWLEVLSRMFDQSDLVSKSRLRALEYFYRGWFNDPRERFPVLCMALDSLVLAQQNFTKQAIQFIRKTIEEPVDDQRLRALLRLRGAVIHGSAPDVYESQAYEGYYSAYGADPINDLDLILVHCMRKIIFAGVFTPHSDPHAEIVKLQQAKGRLPMDMRGNSIISDE